jgi:hypothetical protein
MAKQESKLLDYLDASTAYWQYRYNPAENQIKQPHEQVSRKTDDAWILLFGILGTIGFLVLLAIKTF